mgnify:CR=1 FL=1
MGGPIQNGPRPGESKKVVVPNSEPDPASVVCPGPELVEASDKQSRPSRGTVLNIDGHGTNSLLKKNDRSFQPRPADGSDGGGLS